MHWKIFHTVSGAGRGEKSDRHVYLLCICHMLLMTLADDIQLKRGIERQSGKGKIIQQETWQVQNKYNIRRHGQTQVEK